MYLITGLDCGWDCQTGLWTGMMDWIMDWIVEQKLYYQFDCITEGTVE